MTKVTRRGMGLGAVGLVAASPGPVVAQESAAEPVVSSDFIYDDAPYPEAHASTVVQTTDGTLAAAWFGGTRERNPNVEIWFARREDGRWTTPVSVTTGVQVDGSRHPTWNPVLFQPPGSDLHLFYKVGPTPQDWWGMVMTSADGGRSWSAPRRLPDGILGPIKNKPVVLADGSWLSPSSVELAEGVGAGAGAGWSLHFERSEDRGRSWTRTDPVPSPLNIDAIQPSVLVHADGVLQAVARTRQGALASTWSRDGGRTWSGLGAIDLPNPNSGTDALTLADGRHLLIYNHSGHAAQTPGKGPRYPLMLAVSDDGVRWRPSLVLATEPLPSGYAYPAIIQAADGMIHATWTHDRRRITHAMIDPRRLV
ncbi:exo-alpha-sialidase [Brevundimonas sp.]|jgi:predicted neuraminidase|uniref:sialidase family protein n=1 Tax=Brevundimonas sp. TaxID=1871086 RepID=UPI00378487DF